MKNLIEKLEAAPEGSRELDLDIFLVLNTRLRFTRKELADEHSKLLMGVEHWTTSIDAKIPWENIWLVVCGDDGFWSAMTINPSGRNTEGHGHTEALARRVTALKVHERG